MDNNLLLRYMIAHIRLHTTADISTWTQTQLIESFATLPHPAIPPDEWARRMGLSVETPEEKEQKNMELSKHLGMKVMSFVNNHQARFPKQKEEQEAKKEEAVA